MALNIKNAEAERLASEVAKRTGETLTRAVIVALQERLTRLSGRRQPQDLEQKLWAISQRCAALPDRDDRAADDILGYGAHGDFEPDGH